MLAFYLALLDSEEDKERIVYIYENYYSFMEYCARQILKNDHDIEDVVHSSMLKLIEYIDKIDFSDMNRVKSLCGVIARNKALDHCKLKANQNTSVEDSFVEPSCDDSNPADIVIHNDVYEIAITAINALDDKYRDVCILKYINGLKEREIADVLGVNIKTVNTRINRGRKILRELLKKEKIHV